MKKALTWKLLLFIGLCPFIAPFFYYSIQHLAHNHYSWTLTDMLVLWSFLYWPTYLVGLVLLFVSIYKLRKFQVDSCEGKEHVKPVMNCRKPAFWIVLLAVIACIVVAIYSITNPIAKREFPINGSYISDLDTERVVETIAKAERLDDGSQLCVNGDNFDLTFTPDFKWADDGAIRFFYPKNQKTYSAQLRMFHDENKYFITDSTKWPEQEQSFKLFHYLDALKYMPQEEIRQLSPDADKYSVYQVHDGTPDDYERVLEYGQNGIEEIEGWNIHLVVQPWYEVAASGYSASGDEVIHIFYNLPDFIDD